MEAVKAARFLNVALRMLSLIAKLGLMLYMGRCFSLADMGIYGLVFGAVNLFNTLLGQGFSFVVTRDIVHVEPVVAAHKMRDQALLYGANYLALTLATLTLVANGYGPMAPRIIFYTLILTILESFATITNSNMNSLNQQVMANATFFLRSGMWVVPVVLLGFINPAFRSVDVVLMAWMAGIVLSLAVTLWHWRHLPWQAAIRLPVDWSWMKAGLMKSLLIWLGTVGLTSGTYIDRFVVEHYLSLNDVGVVTFYFAFASAIQTLMQSGVLAFAYPRLIAMHRDGHVARFEGEARQAFRQVATGAGLMVLALGIAVPMLGMLTERPALVSGTMTLWLMLCGTWIKANSETLNYVLYARHQDRAIWLGNLMFLIPAFGGNLLLVPLIGLPGIGWATIIAAAFLFLWRWKYVAAMNAK